MTRLYMDLYTFQQWALPNKDRPKQQFTHRNGVASTSNVGSSDMVVGHTSREKSRLGPHGQPTSAGFEQRHTELIVRGGTCLRRRETRTRTRVQENNDNQPPPKEPTQCRAVSARAN